MKKSISLALRASMVASVLACGGAFAAAPVIAQVGAAMTNYAPGKDSFAIGTDGHIREIAIVNNVVTTRDLTAELGAMPAVYGSSLSSLNALFDTPFSLIYTSADGHLHKMSRSLSTQAWSYIDMTAHASVAQGGTGAVQPAARNTSISSIGLQGQHYRIYYIDVNNHVQELADANSGSWVTTDLTAVTGSVGAIAGSAVTAIDHRESGGNFCIGNCGLPGSPAPASTSGEYPRVYYIDPNNHVQELAWANSSWHLADISNSSGSTASLPAPGSALTSIDYMGDPDVLGKISYYPRVYFLDTIGHVHELAWASGWHAADISAAANAPAARSGSAMASLAWNGGNDPKVYYFAYDGRVLELQWWHGWIVNDLLPLTCAPLAAPGSAIASYQSNVQQDSFPSGVTYFSADAHIHQLKQSMSSGWVQIDLNGAGTEQGCTSSGGGGGGGGTRPVLR
jgi:hypothetical protein